MEVKNSMGSLLVKMSGGSHYAIDIWNKITKDEFVEGISCAIALSQILGVLLARMVQGGATQKDEVLQSALNRIEESLNIALEDDVKNES